MSSEELILAELKEIKALLKAQVNLTDSLHKLFNQLNGEYLLEINKEAGLINSKEPE